MRRTALRGHALRGEGQAYKRRDEGNWLKVWGGWRGVGLCECGATSSIVDTNNARKRWHVVHKAEVRAQTEGSSDECADSDQLPARLAQIRERNEAHIEAMRYTEWTVRTHPCGDLRRALAALEAALKVAGEFDAEDGVLPGAEGEDAAGLGYPVTRGDRVRSAITAELLGEPRPGLRETGEQ